MAADADRRVITLHHFAGSGGTIIAKAIAAIGGTIVLSEIHPDRHLRGQYHPLVQLRQGYGDLLDDDDLRTIDEHFVEEIELVHGIASKHGRRLVIRDHAHRDFIETDRFRSRLLDLLADRFEPVSLVSIRDPVDCYLSQLASDSGSGPWYRGEPGEFCRRLLAFADAFAGAAFLRYEDFVDEPEGAMQGLCARLGLRFDPDFRGRLESFTHFTGDSGRRSDVIAPRPRRELDDAMAIAFADSSSYRELCRRLGYERVSSATPTAAGGSRA